MKKLEKSILFNLWSNEDIRPSGFSSDLDPIRQRAGCSLSPAGPAVLRDVLKIEIKL
jgi:hypothetical protein